MMNRRPPPSKPAFLPVVLLVVAWCCASTSQTLSFRVATWAKGARHFSHQQQLKDQIADLLAGPHPRPALASAPAPRPPPPAAPPAGESVTKRLDWPPARDAEPWLMPSASAPFALVEYRAAPAERAEPPQPPPRVPLPV